MSRFSVFSATGGIPGDGGGRPRILALCGAKSNDSVTRMQLENLLITPDSHDIHFLHGNIEEEEGDAGLEGLVRGPFYSWIDAEGSEEAVNESIVNAVRLVIKAADLYGPFDAVYGFSNGGLIATLAANVHSDPKLSAAVMSSNGSTTHHIKRVLIPDSHVLLEVAPSASGAGESAANKARASVLGRGRASRMSGRASRRSEFGGGEGRNSFFGFLGRGVHRGTMGGPLVIAGLQFNAVICACAGTSMERGIQGIGCSDLIGGKGGNGKVEGGTAGLVEVPSLHIVGLEDPLKASSESIAKLFMGAKVMYLPGGHSISRDERHDKDLHAAIRDLLHPDDNDIPHPGITSFKEINPVTSIAVQSHQQVSRNRMNKKLLPSGKLKGGATILACLSDQPPNNPFLVAARDPSGAATTYGQARDFIQGGEGDLRRLGVKEGEVVAYGAPPGGGAAAAMAFLCIGAQTTAAPLAPGMTEPEVLDALDQFHAKHLILFEGVNAPGVKDAFEKYAADGNGKLHTARILGPNKPGLFKFSSDQVSMFKSYPILSNPENGHCLLLRTSGTTARPKGVPLEQGSLVDNGAIIAASMQLTDADVCYSVMPLFHIGGISASIICTMASGGTVCCDGEPFDPSRMVDALAISNPQPTWYSSVPTIHNATVNFLKEHAGKDSKFARYGIDVKTGVWERGHSLRMIRSGAAALLAPDADALSKTYGGVPIYPTYSMSEQMPISQPPAGKVDTITDKPGSVGVPVATSLAIVSRSHLRPQPYGQEGEIAISGPTVMRNYLENPDADRKNYFLLTLPGDAEDQSPAQGIYFLTGDVGVLDKEGFLSLKGRAKELIKKGGEQVSPYEVEEVLLDHPWVQIPVCFAVPSKVYGEEVGCAIVLNSDAPKVSKDNEIIKSLRKWMKEKKFAPVKWPTKWWIGPDEDLPKTKTKKYIRVGLAEKLGFGEEEKAEAPSKEMKAKIDWGVITGFRFFLACYVMFMHIGSNESWGHFNNLRGWPWHVHCFYTLGGYSMASPMNPIIKKKFSYFFARIGNMYPMYTMALIFGLINLLVVCRPSTFDPNFHWDGQPDDQTRGFFCEGTPGTRTSYWGSLFLTIAIYIFGWAVTPFWPFNWWMGYYLWFSSMYYQCLAVFPAMYNYLFTKARKNLKFLLKLMFWLQVLNGIILVAGWFSMRSGPSYNHYNPETGQKNPPEEYDNAYGSGPVVYNAVILSFYLFAPFWALYFVIGGVLAFIYDAYKPAERHNAYIWGYVADACTLIQLTLTIVIICQPLYNDPENVRWFRPSDANYIGDSSSVNRLWDNLCGRIMAPLTTLWIFAMSTGHGYTAAIFRGDFLVHTLGPNSYNCFLFHQMVGQWYYAATRGEFWNWWAFRKSFYWFSPGPCPVEWYEYFYVVSIVVMFSDFMDNTFTPTMKAIGGKLQGFLKSGEEEEEINVAETLCELIEKMTGIEPEMDSTLDEVGLASVGIPVIVSMLNSAFSSKSYPITITSSDLVEAKTIEDIVGVVEGARARMEHDGV
jgi:acyl-CoA synthetase (AMP-forming)/AMP-acid ligase II